MCGIAAFIGEDEERIRRMTASLVHRGPDGTAVWTGGGVSMGHARLAILDPTPRGDQPMWNASKEIVIVYNGEIFNYKKLREDEKLDCETGTDTEVILKLYEQHGIACVEKLLGMFAFVLYDLRTKTLHVVRDESGIKPLYVTSVEGTLCVASEMRALLSVLKTKPPIDLRSLSLFLTLQYVPGPRTLCEGIESVPPGTILTLREGKETRRRFKAAVPAPNRMTPPEARQSLPSLLQDVVTSHLVSDRPVGMFLSGGMDSSVILHHMAHATKEPVNTFTVRFEATEAEDAKRFNRDADLAKLTAAHYGTNHEELLLTAETYRSLYRDTTKALDLPNADSVSVAQFALSRQAKKKVDVVLSGAGGDELFGGYPRYRIARILHALRFVPPSVRAFLGGVAGYPRDVLRLRPGPELALRLLGRPSEEIRHIVKGTWFEDGAADGLFRERFASEFGRDPVRDFMEFDRHLWLVDESLRLCDAVTMASGLEMRVPMLDPRLIAWSLGTPSTWHVGLRRTKCLLKDAYREILPAHLYALEKASFYPPLSKWLRRECAPLVQEAVRGKRIGEYFDPAAIEALLSEHRAGRYRLHQLQNIIQLHHWFETVYDA